MPCFGDCLCCISGRRTWVQLQIWWARQELFAVVCRFPATNRSLVISLSSSLDSVLRTMGCVGGLPVPTVARIWFWVSVWTDISWWVFPVQPQVSLLLPPVLVWLRFFHPFGCLQIRSFGSLDLLSLLRKRLSRKPFGSAGEVLTFREEPVLTEVPWASFGLFIAAAYGKKQPCSHWRMRNDSLILACNPLGCFLQNWPIFFFFFFATLLGHNIY